MTSLVTGATGFVGGNVARALWKRGDDVRALVRPGANEAAIRDTSIQRYPGDLLDVDSLRRAVAGCRFVYHCAATYSFWARRPADIYRSNVEGTRNILTAAQEAGVERVVFTSSVSTIGLPQEPSGGIDSTRLGNAAVLGDPGILGDEKTALDPSHLVGHYKRSKYQSEQLALQANGNGLPVVVVNPCAPVGKWDVKPTPTGRIPLDFARGRIPGYLNTGLNLVDVADVADGHILAMERGEPGHRYILGSRNLTLQQIFAMLADITGRRAPRWRFPYWLVMGAAYLDQAVEGGIMHRQPTIPVEGIKVSQRPMYVTSHKAITQLGMPQNSVESALAKAIRWFTDHGYLQGDR